MTRTEPGAKKNLAESAERPASKWEKSDKTQLITYEQNKTSGVGHGDWTLRPGRAGPEYLRHFHLQSDRAC